MTTIDDATLDALLAAGDEALADDGFTAAVMRRVQRAEAQRLAKTVDAATALAWLDQRAARSSRSRRWRWAGVVAGSGVALLTLQAAGSAPLLLGASQALALLVGLAASAWALLAEG